MTSPRTSRPSWLDALGMAYRRWGYLQAELDPLDRVPRLAHPDLEEAAASAGAEHVRRWSEAYCGSLGVEFMHMADRERCEWIAAQMEEADPPAVDEARVLRRLAQAELFERFLHRRYVGTKRYSLEGSIALIPLLDAVLDTAIDHHGEIALLAMSHRGRLNVMVNVVGIAERDLFTGLEDVDPKSVLGSGDVKYHLGATGTYQRHDRKRIALHLVSNPSHLEAVDPVLAGRARARQQRCGARGRHQVLPICLHGDAAFAGQGITAETLNLAQLRGYDVGGTVHVLVNNLIGFTAEPAALHSSRFSSDLARRLDVPILHVNGEDPPAVVRAARLAAAYRYRFGSDVVIDLIGYRRYGHSEVEDPTTTSPLLYETIGSRPMLWESYAERIGLATAARGALVEEIQEHLQQEQEVGRSSERRPVLRQLPSYWDPYRGGRYDPGLEVDTTIDLPTLEAIGGRLLHVPPGFAVHPKVDKLFQQRKEMLEGSRPLDFGLAETMAFASLVWQGVPVRLSGQDSRRGTFNQRHAVLRDVKTGAEHVPLASLREDQGFFEIYDSPLSEAAVLGFEYGFSRDYPDALVGWEAQFGDFANGAQIILDQFVAAGEDKWGLLSGLVILVPHGYEGQGPEHSSARLERFLQLAAEDNIQVCQPATAGQYFHLLRRQALRPWRKPLVVMTPKGMLRSKAALSPREELLEGGFLNVRLEHDRVDCERILICSGKIAHELEAVRDELDPRTTILCLAQLHPFPEQELAEELRRHPRARKIVWVQEEPANMGALAYVRPHLQRLAGDRHVTTVKRRASASPATGSPNAHRLEQAALLKLAFA